MAALLYSIGVIAALLLVGAGAVALHRSGERKRPLLMIVAGLVILANVVLWAAPVRTERGP